MVPAKAITIKRTESSDLDFPQLIALLNLELKEIYDDLHLLYERFNQIKNLETVVIAYANDMPVGCGCFKKINSDTIEIKRMFVKPAERKQGIAYSILSELEVWAKEEGFTHAVLETGNKQEEAIALYQKIGYSFIPNYGQYIGMESSVCMGKTL